MRRTTLGPITHSSTNTRRSTGARRSMGGDAAKSSNPRSKRHSMAAAQPVSRRASIGGMRSRQSSAFGGGAWSGRGISDPRPIREKGFINDSMKVLIEYLCEHQYEHPISPKILKRPSSKDVNNILQFLFRQIDPRFKVQAARAEDDVAKMFGTLRYPFKVSKSALQAAGAEHTWPALLGAITWLIELLKYDEEVTTGEGGIDTEAADKVFFDYLSRAYGAFLSAEDEVFEELETELRENFDVRNKDIQDDMERLDSENAQMRAEIEHMKATMMPLDQKEQKAQDAQSDLLKFQQYKVKLGEHRNKLEGQISDKQEELRQRQADLEQGRAEKLRLQTKIKSQDLNMADVKRMDQEKARMNDAMQVATAHKDELQQNVWNLQSDIDAKTEELQQFVGSYSSTTEALELRPPTATFANGLDFSINFETEARDRIFKVDLIKVIKPALMSVKTRTSQSLMAAREQEMELQDEVETSADAVSQARQESGKLEAKVKHTEAQCRREKEHAKHTLDHIGVESDSVEDEIVQMREGDKESREAELVEQQQLLHQLQTKLAVQREAHTQLQEQINSEIMETLQGLTDHKTHMQTQLARTKAYITEKKKELESEE